MSQVNTKLTEQEDIPRLEETTSRNTQSSSESSDDGNIINTCSGSLVYS